MVSFNSKDELLKQNPANLHGYFTFHCFNQPLLLFDNMFWTKLNQDAPPHRETIAHRKSLKNL